MIYQRERCPETQREHWQGYVELRKQMRFDAVKRMLGNDVHFERRAGTQQDAIAYCSKEETRVLPTVSHGTAKKQGKRRDLKYLKRAAIKRTVPYNKLLYRCKNYQQAKFVQLLRSVAETSLDFTQMEVHWYHGKAGTGKTRSAYEALRRHKAEGMTCYIANQSSAWFDGYCEQDVVLIDELRAKNWPYDTMLNLLDGYEERVQIKGGHTIWCPKIVYITAPLSPEATYAGTLQYQGGIDQLRRRLTDIKCFDKPDMMVVQDGRITGAASCPLGMNDGAVYIELDTDSQ